MNQEWWYLVFGLVFITVIIFCITRIAKQIDFSELLQRVKLWWGMLFVFSLSMYIHPAISIVTLGFLSFFALKEFYQLNKLSKKDKNIYYCAYLAIPFQFYWIYDGWYGMFIIFIPVYVFLFLPLVRIFTGGTVGFVKSVATTHWGLMLMVFGLSHLAFYPQTDAIWGPKMVLYLVILTQLNDVVHYFVAKLLTSKRIVSHTVHHLSWLGLFFGLFFTTASSLMLAPYLTPMKPTEAFFAGLLIAFAGFVGTLNIAYLKRDLQLAAPAINEPPKVIRNESFLSKIDSLTYTAPLFLHYIRYFSDLF